MGANFKRLLSLVPSREVGVCDGTDMSTEGLPTDYMKYDPGLHGSY